MGLSEASGSSETPALGQELLLRYLPNAFILSGYLVITFSKCCLICLRGTTLKEVLPGWGLKGKPSKWIRSGPQQGGGRQMRGLSRRHHWSCGEWVPQPGSPPSSPPTNLGGALSLIQ